jgi:acylphosphatase
VLAQGHADAIDALAVWLRRGPPLARVAEVLCDAVEERDVEGFVAG